MLAFFIFKPYIAPVFLAAIIAIVAHPFYKRLLKIFGEKKSIASFVMVFIVLAVVLVPSIFIGMALFDEATSFYGHISSGQANGAGFLVLSKLLLRARLVFLLRKFQSISENI